MQLVFITNPVLILSLFACLVFDVLLFVLPKGENLFCGLALISLTTYILSSILFGCPLIEILMFVLILSCIFLLFYLFRKKVHHEL